jgi:chromosome segregation ATPase
MRDYLAALEASIVFPKVQLEEAKTALAVAESRLFETENSLAKSGESLDGNRAKQREIELKIAELQGEKTALGVAEGLLMAEVVNNTQAVGMYKQDVAGAGMNVNTMTASVADIQRQIDEQVAAIVAADNEPEPEPVIEPVSEPEPTTEPVAEPAAE